MVQELLSLAALVDNIPGTTYLEVPTATDPVIARHDLPNLAARNAMAASNVPAHHENVRIPSLHVAGWYDLFVQGTIDNYMVASQESPARLVIGPWNHVGSTSQQGDINFGLTGNGYVIDYSTSILGLTFDWLHSWLTKGEEPNQDAPVKLYVMGANEWRSEAEWPLERAVDTRFHLTLDAGLALSPGLREEGLTYKYDPEDPTPTVGGATVMPYPPSGAFDQRLVEARPDVLVFTSDVLMEDVEVTGRVTATLLATTDGPTTDWVVRLCDVHADGRSFNVTDGIRRVEVAPNEPVRIEVDLWSTSMLFKKGHRIRVQVTSSCFPRWDRNLNTVDGLTTAETRVATQTVHVGRTAESYVTLPIVPRGSDERR